MLLTESATIDAILGRSLSEKVKVQKELTSAFKTVGKGVIAALAAIGVAALLHKDVSALAKKIVAGLDKIKLRKIYDKFVSWFGEKFAESALVFTVAFVVAEAAVMAYNKVVAKKLLEESILFEAEEATEAKPDKSFLKKMLIGAGKAAAVVFPAIKYDEETGKFSLQFKGLKVSEYVRMVLAALVLGLLAAGLYISRKNGISFKDAIVALFKGIVIYIREHKTAVIVVLAVALAITAYVFRDKLKSMFKKGDEEATVKKEEPKK